MRADNRLAIICLVLIAVLIGAAFAEKYRECTSQGQAEAACLSLLSGKPARDNAGRLNVQPVFDHD